MRNKRLIKLLATAVTVALTLPVGMHASVQTRVGADNTYQKAAFAPATGTTPAAMYLGAGTVGTADEDKAAALARVTLNTEAGNVVGNVESLAPDVGVTVNATTGASPLHGKTIVNLKLNGDLPVVTVSDATSGVHDKTVYALTKNDGTAMLKNVGGGNPHEQIFDAGGAETNAIVGLAVGKEAVGGKETVFAAVTETLKDWQTADGAVDGVKRGIAVLRPNDAATALEVLDATNFGGANAMAAQLIAETKDTLTDADRTALTALSDALTAAGVIAEVTPVELATIVDGVAAAVAHVAAIGGGEADGNAVKAAMLTEIAKVYGGGGSKDAGLAAVDAALHTGGAHLGAETEIKAAINTALAAVDADATAVADATAATKEPVIAVVGALNDDFANLKIQTDAAKVPTTINAQQFVAQATEYTSQVNTARNHLSFAPRVEVAKKLATKTAELGPNVDMHWSTNLNRLYIGLNNVHRDDPTKEGGIMGLVMGRIDEKLGTPVGGKPSGALVLQPVVSGLKKDHFYDNADPNTIDEIVGFYFDGQLATNGQVPVKVSVRQVRDMFTSTSKNYLIVNSNIGGGGTTRNARVYALPVAPQVDPNGADVESEKVGTLMKRDAGGVADWSGGAPNFPAAIDGMPRALQPATKVGSFNTDKISDIFVVGDTVYMAMKGDTAATAGIISSTALFNEGGVIREWTPPVRVTGDVNSVLAVGQDTAGNFYAATGSSNDPAVATSAFTDINTVKVTQWGKSDDVTSTAATANTLSSLLATEFPESTGGIVAMHSFDQFTPGFRQGKFAMLVVVGPTKIALIQMGTYRAGGFVPTQEFIKDTNVFIRDTATDSDLGKIAPLTCAEVSRMTADDSGWLFVGGYGGVAVLRTDIGNGFASQAPGFGALNGGAAGYPGDTTAWTFKQLKPQNNVDAFNSVVKMVAWNGRLYVVTLDGVFFFDMAVGKFTDAAVVASPTNLGDDKVAGLPAGAVVADLVVLSPTTAAADNRGIIATDQGIFASNLSHAAAETVKIDAALFGELGLQLQLLGSNKRAGNAPESANMMVLGVDFKNNTDKLYRMDVPEDKVSATAALDFAKPVKLLPETDGKVVAFDSTKQGFSTNGTNVVATLPKHYEHLDYVTLHQVAKSDSQDITSLLNIDTDKEKWVSGVVREGAFGAVLVPGDFGLRVNE